MAKRRSFIDRLPLGPVFALMFGSAVAIVIAATPQPLFDSAVASTGLGDAWSLAQPPLGMKARILAVLLGFAVVAGLVWLAVEAVQRVLAGRRDVVDDQPVEDEALDLTGYISPDVPRRPIFADKELGAPFMSDEALATAAPLTLTSPDDVENAEAVEEAEFEDVVSQEPLAAPLDPVEFALPPETGAPPIDGESSIDALIRRLEAGLARRAGPPPPSPPSSAVAPVTAASDWLSANREVDGSNDDGGNLRALDTLQRMALRRIAS